jgi:hypothetical protein
MPTRRIIDSQALSAFRTGAQDFEAYHVGGRLADGFVRLCCDKRHSERLMVFNRKKR